MLKSIDSHKYFIFIVSDGEPANTGRVVDSAGWHKLANGDRPANLKIMTRVAKKISLESNERCFIMHAIDEIIPEPEYNPIFPEKIIMNGRTYKLVEEN